jgi:hypothetical protein
VPGLTRTARFLLAAVLLAGWQAALEHPLAHLDEHGAFVHLASEHAPHEQGRAKDSPLCDAIAAVAVAVGCASTSAAFAASAFAAAAEAPVRAWSNAPLAASSRDPPPLL